MSRCFLLGFSILFLGLCIVVSCSDEGSNDNEPPIIEIINPEPDTIIETTADTFYIFRARFTDNEGLSSYSIRIYSALLKGDMDTATVKSSLGISPEEGGTDSALYNKAFQYGNIFDKTDTTITVFTGYRVEPMVNRIPTSLGKHWFKVNAIDKNGNVAVDSFAIYVKAPPTLPTPPEEGGEEEEESEII